MCYIITMGEPAVYGLSEHWVETYTYFNKIVQLTDCTHKYSKTSWNRSESRSTYENITDEKRLGTMCTVTLLLSWNTHISRSVCRVCMCFCVLFLLTIYVFRACLQTFNLYWNRISGDIHESVGTYIYVNRSENYSFIQTNILLYIYSHYTHMDYGAVRQIG